MGIRGKRREGGKGTRERDWEGGRGEGERGKEGEGKATEHMIELFLITIQFFKQGATH